MSRLDKELWDRVQPLLDEVLELPVDQRADRLRKVRSESATVADEIERLLAADAALTGEGLGAGPLRSLAEPEVPGGRVVGAYTLERPIGYGGMGTVWLGHRSDGRFEGRVAIKLLNLALVGRAGAERFAQEGTVLARLTHPNIARLLDAGVTPSGQPYLVLEYVEGERVDEFVNRHRWPAERRIELMLDVLAAVGSAHANLVVHRDIKPSNILVTADGTAKLLDFGIAKLITEGRATGEASLTDPGGRALTPEYAAPEQIRGDPISTATDVYSLGVLLYVLLAGVHPTGPEADAPLDHLRSTLDTDPPRLSEATARTGSPEERRRNAAARAATPDRLQRFYAGDLDNILAKALRKDPAERYPTVTAFADDLVRFLTHQPVSARPDSWRYRASKFLRRHRGAVVATAVTVLSLIGGTTLAVRQAVVAERQRDEAIRAMRRSSASMNFDATLFRLMGPSSPPMTYRQLLDKGREALELQYRRDPHGAVQLASQFAWNYDILEDLDTEEAILHRAARTADSIGDPGRQAHLRCRLAGVYARTRRKDSARILLRRAGELLQRAAAFDQEPRNECDRAEGELYMQLVQGDSAARAYRRMVDRYVALGDTASTDYPNALNSLAVALIWAYRTRESEPLLLRLVALTRSGASADPAEYPVTVFNAMSTMVRLGEFRDALQFLHRELGARGAGDSTLAGNGLIRYGLATVFWELGLRDSAEVYFRRALDRPDDFDAPFEYLALTRLAAIARGRGAVREADAWETRARGMYPKVQDTGEAQSTVAVARIEAARGAPKEQLGDTIRAALKSLNYSPTARWETLIPTLIVASGDLARVGEYRDASRYAADLIRITALDSLTYSRSGLVGTGLLLQARAERGLGDRAKARDLVRRAAAALEFGLGSAHQLTRAAVALADST